MHRRQLILAGLATALAPHGAFAQTTMRIWGLWANNPNRASNGLDQLKGVLNFRVNNETSDRRLNVYGSGPRLDNPRQCVELIKRYANNLRFAGYTAALAPGDYGNHFPGLGHGHAAASGFASASGGRFTFVANGANSLPKPGAVISIADQAGTGRIPNGHVGIICNHSDADEATGTVNIKIVEQNMPIDTWKEIRFIRGSNGRWTGTMMNLNAPQQVVGWANPNG